MEYNNTKQCGLNGKTPNNKTMEVELHFGYILNRLIRDLVKKRICVKLKL